MFSDNKDFYPTPKDLFYRLLNGKRYLDGRILEPSAGKGDLIKYIREMNRNSGKLVDAIESDPRLSSVLMSEGIDVVWDDFLTYETFKEYAYIVMNPPFSNGVDHVLKALELAENQLTHCEIYAILNKATIDNAYSDKRQDLLRKLDDHGAEIRYVSEGFSQAERQTDVEVALIHVKVRKEGAGKSIYDSIPFKGACINDESSDSLETALSTFVQASEIQAKMNDIERLIIEYETACKLSKDTFEAIRAKSSFFSYIGKVNKRKGEVGTPFTHVESKEFSVDDLSRELERLRSGYWQLILDTDEFRKLLTNEAIQKLNRQLSAANAMEINLANVRMLLVALGTNQRDILTESVIAIFKKITTYHMNEYSANIHYYDGWKTNNAYKVNKKIVIPIKHAFDPAWDFSEDYERITYEAREWVDDIVKAFQLIDPTVSNEFEYIGNKSFENGLLRFRMFLNGNIHVWFNDLTLLAKLNYFCGQHFDWIPSDGEQQADVKAREWVAREFGDISGSVRLTTRAKDSGSEVELIDEKVAGN